MKQERIQAMSYTVTMRRSRNQLLLWKRYKYYISECVFVTLSIQHAMRMHNVVFCGLSGSTIFLHIISQTARFSGGGLLKTKCEFLFSLEVLSEKFLIIRRTERDMIKYIYTYINVYIYIIVHAKCRYLCPISITI
jgi:hypothetical protein